MDDKFINLKNEIEKINIELRSIFEKKNIYSKLEKHNKKMLDANFWQNKSNSKNIVKEKKLFEDLISSFQNSGEKLKDLDDLYQLATDENNQAIQDEVFRKYKIIKKYS